VAADLVKYAAVIAHGLFGKADGHLSDERHLRFGEFSVNLETGTFFNSSTDDGGTMVDLVRQIQGVENGTADAWIEETIAHYEAVQKQSGESINRELPIDDDPLRDFATERAIIGACILRPDQIGVVIEEIESTDFAEPIHQEVFASIAGMVLDDTPVKIKAIIAACGGDDGNPVVTGFTLTQYLARLAADALSGDEFVDQAREMSIRLRELREARIATIDDFEKEADREIARNKARFKLRAFKDVVMRTTAIYRVRGILPMLGLAVVWGPPKCGKSFWLYDLCMHIAMGWEYRGRKTMQGSVVYMVLEGDSGYAQRVQAFRNRFLTGNENVPMYDIVTSIDLIKDHQQLIRDLKAQLGDIAPAVVAIDTLNRSLKGSENDPEAMTAYVRAADAIREAFSCVVAVVHHCGAEGVRPRGHTALTGAADVQLAVRRDENKNVVVKLEYVKDGPEGEVIVNRLESVQVGREIDGHPIYSCVVVDQEGQGPVVGFRAKPEELRFLRCLLDAIEEHGVAPSTVHGLELPKSIEKVVDFKHVREKFFAGAQIQVHEDEERNDGVIRQTLARAGRWLANSHVVATYKPKKSAQFIWYTGRPVAGLMTAHEAPAKEQPPLPPDAADINPST
jgi:hypothetical protein